MSTLSIRKIPEEIEKALIREAKKTNKTKTDIVIEALRQKFHMEPKSVRRQSLRAFFGKMTKKEYDKFKTVTQPFGEIDREMWD